MKGKNINHPQQERPLTKSRPLHPVNMDTLVNFIFGENRVRRGVRPSRTENRYFMPTILEIAGKIRRVLGRSNSVRIKSLVD